MDGHDYAPDARPGVTSQDISSAVRNLGLPVGALVQVHSSMSRLGHVVGGANAIVDALLDAVCPAGTVMVPTFNHGMADVYDVAATPSVNGAVTEALRKRPEAHRSIHPTHPYAAIGLDAAQLIAGHLDVETFSPVSPLGKLADMGGFVLLLGIGMAANTAAHIGEAMARVHCIGFNQFPRRVRLDDGRIIPAWGVVWRDGPCRLEWDPLEERMRNRGMIRTGRIGAGEAHLMRARDVVQTAYELTFELCPGCPTRPDWDSLNR